MKKVIVYGLGKNYELLREQLANAFDIVGVSDRNTEKKELYDNYIFPNELQYTTDYDYIIATPSDEMVVSYLINRIGIEDKRIISIAECQEKFYAQNAEDIVLAYIFKTLDIPFSEIKYLELGVCHPIEINNTYFFYKHGARGILIDANPECRELVQLLRPRDSFKNVAIARESKEEFVNFYISENRGLCSLSEKVIEEKAARNGGAHIEKIIQVPQIGINELLSDIDYDLDLVSIDIEGFDKETIMGWDFTLKLPKVIVIELIDYETAVFMATKGYYCYMRIGSNSIYVLHNYKQLLKGQGLEVNNP